MINEDQIAIIAHCFVSRSDWPAWRKINSDISIDYDAFLERLKKFCEEVAKKGGRAVKVEVKPDVFLAWCRRTSRNIDATARGDYAATRLIELEGDTGSE